MKLAEIFNLVAFTVATAAVGLTLVFGEPLLAAATAISFFALTVILSKFGKLDKAKLDLDDRSIELDGQDEK